MKQKFLVFSVLLQVIGSIEMASIELSLYKMLGEPNPEVGVALDEFDPATDERNPEELGTYMDGDILLPATSDIRNGLISLSARWANATVPYIVSGNYTATQYAYITQAMAIYHSTTCVRFVPRTIQTDYLSIESGASGCWSVIGRVGGKQTSNLQTPGCVTKVGSVLHELMHVLGFFHEHNRFDRDSYVFINYTNIQPRGVGNFNKLSNLTTTSFGVTYDYDSILHYTAYAYSINGLPTIVPLVPAPNLGKATTLSQKDITKIKRMYNCPGAWS